MSRMLRTLSVFTIACVVPTVGLLAAEGEPDRAELEKQFQKTLSGATLVGSFTVTGGEKDRALREERYTISKVTRGQGDFWVFHCRVQYGDRDVTVPLPLEVKWAGDTPVITLTKLELPQLGTYTARVMIYNGKYAGTWSASDHGGHLFGTIEKNAEEPAAQ